jgi:hypothetical protein
VQGVEDFTSSIDSKPQELAEQLYSPQPGTMDGIGQRADNMTESLHTQCLNGLLADGHSRSSLDHVDPFYAIR